MRRLKDTKTAWAIKWVQNSSLDGRVEHFIGNGDRSVWLFSSRQRAREAVKEKFDYIQTRQDLKAAPHGWTVPRVVFVTVTVSERS